MHCAARTSHRNGEVARHQPRGVASAQRGDSRQARHHRKSNKRQERTQSRGPEFTPSSGKDTCCTRSCPTQSFLLHVPSSHPISKASATVLTGNATDQGQKNTWVSFTCSLTIRIHIHRKRSQTPKNEPLRTTYCQRVMHLRQRLAMYQVANNFRFLELAIVIAALQKVESSQKCIHWLETRIRQTKNRLKVVMNRNKGARSEEETMLQR